MQSTRCGYLTHKAQSTKFKDLRPKTQDPFRYPLLTMIMI